jgi:hypothetical protein
MSVFLRLSLALGTRAALEYAPWRVALASLARLQARTCACGQGAHTHVSCGPALHLGIEMSKSELIAPTFYLVSNTSEHVCYREPDQLQLGGLR